MLINLFFNKSINLESIAKSISVLFELRENQVGICKYEDLIKFPNDNQLILLILDKQEGDFYFSMEINSKKIELPKEIHLSFIGKLAEKLEAECLVSNDYFDVYTEGMILVKGPEKYTGVLIDEDERYGPPFCIIEKWTSENLTYDQLKEECKRLYNHFYG